MRKSRRERLALLDTAFDSGVRHFDLARMYGLGMAESEIGGFAFGRRDQITITTKFGLGLPGWVSALAPYQAPARAALERLPSARRSVKQRSDQPPSPRTYSAAQARDSLEVSLAKLGTDYVDFFLVHDPRPGDDVRTDELLEFFTSARAAGKIRAWGVSGDAHPDLRTVHGLGPQAVAQMRADILDRDALSEPPGITFGIIGQAYARVLEAFRTNFTMRTRWSRDLDVDLTHPESLARLIFEDALAYNPDGILLYSTLNPERLRSAALSSHAAPDLPRVNRFRELVHAELR